MPGESSDLRRHLKRKNKSKPKPGVGFHLKAFCYIKSEVALSRSSGSSDRVPVSTYRIIDMVNKPNTDFYEYELQRLGRGDVMVDWYREAELEVVDMTRPLGLYRTGERGGEGSSTGWSRGDGEWDAKTLVDRKDGEATLCGD